jgi:hypothetical protein
VLVTAAACEKLLRTLHPADALGPAFITLAAACCDSPSDAAAIAMLAVVDKAIRRLLQEGALDSGLLSPASRPVYGMLCRVMGSADVTPQQQQSARECIVCCLGPHSVAQEQQQLTLVCTLPEAVASSWAATVDLGECQWDSTWRCPHC